MSGNPPLGPSGHLDEFARRNLPPADQWPKMLLDRPEFQYPEYLNAAVELTDRIVEKGMGDRIALIGNGRQRTYKELADWSNRLAHALVENYGVKPGNRVLIRSGNNPALVAAWLAATKAGAVVVNTMPLLRARSCICSAPMVETGSTYSFWASSGWCVAVLEPSLSHCHIGIVRRAKPPPGRVGRSAERAPNCQSRFERTL